MKAFTTMLPSVLAEIRAMNRTVVVSEIQHRIGSHRLGRKIVHGYIVTDAAERLIRVFMAFNRVVFGTLDSQPIINTDMHLGQELDRS